MKYNRSMEKQDIRCPYCGKKIAEKEKNRNTEGIYFWCNRCKKEFQEFNSKNFKS